MLSSFLKSTTILQNRDLCLHTYELFRIFMVLLLKFLFYGENMAHLLIEDLAKELGKDPQQLSPVEFKKYLILIDSAIALETDEELHYLKKTELSQEQVTRLMDLLVREIKEGTFATLDKKSPDSGDMDDAFIELAQKLGFEEKANKMVDELSTPMISDYDTKIQKNAYLHTAYLIYKPDLSSEAVQETNKANDRLNSRYEKLRNAKVFTAKISEIIIINKANNQLEVKNIELLNASKKYAKSESSDTVYFYLDIMSTLKDIFK